MYSRGCIQKAILCQNLQSWKSLVLVSHLENIGLNHLLQEFSINLFLEEFCRENQMTFEFFQNSFRILLELCRNSFGILLSEKVLFLISCILLYFIFVMFELLGGIFTEKYSSRIPLFTLPKLPQPMI